MAIVFACASFAHAADGPGKLLALEASKGSKTSAITASSPGRRIALVIGNGNYQYPDSLPRLANPANDAHDIAAALRGFGFEVIEKKDQSLEGMHNAVAEFSRKLGNSDAALFYFAGHGLQVKGQNYLIPVDAKIETEARVQYVSLNVNQILEEMENGHSRANIVMLDACRNNPISGKFRSGTTRGLAPITSQPKGTVIVYATDPGNVAEDGSGRNGLFTSGLLTALKGSDLSLLGVLTRASAEVERGSEQKQTPYVNGPLTLQRNFHFRITVDTGKGEIEKTFWTSIERSTDIADFEAYLRNYPNGSYRDLAENQIRRLKAIQPVAPTQNTQNEEGATRIVVEREAREAERQRLAAETTEAIDLSGTWRPEHVSGQVYIFNDGTCIYKGFVVVTIGGKWSRTDPQKRVFSIVWNHGFTDVMTLSADGQRLVGINNIGDPVSFVRNK
ncbi:MAG: caspase family protein [Betaproteobacteria bacterium]